MRAIGFRPHTGWAAYSIVEGTLAAPRLIDRGRVELIDSGLPGHAYHAAQDLPLDDAVELIDAAWTSAQATADRAVADLVREHGAMPVAIIGAPRELPPLERILASHPLLHTAEGALFVTVLEEAAERAGLATTIVAPGSLPPLTPKMANLGKAFGPPWRRDHKEAALAALIITRDSPRDHFAGVPGQSPQHRD